MPWSKKLTRHIKHNKFLYLFLLILLWLILEPLTFSFPHLRAILNYLYALLLILILYVSIENKIIFFICFILVAADSIIPLFVFDHPENLTLKMGALILSLISNIIITALIIWRTAAKSHYDRDDIFAGILAFLLIGACFGDIYFSMAAFRPEVVHFAKDAFGGHSLSMASEIKNTHIAFGDFLYFSYMTLTTVGYGDIYPVSYIAKRLCSLEACTGVIYIAVFIGRILILYDISHRKNI